jgi:hypothetical protein
MFLAGMARCAVLKFSASNIRPIAPGNIALVWCDALAVRTTVVHNAQHLQNQYQ